VAAVDLYEAIVKSEPDSSTSNKSPTANSPFFSQATGLSDGYSHTIRVSPGRVDWILSKPQPEDSDPFANLIDIDDGFPAVRNYFDSFTHDLFFNVTRLSIVCILASKADSINEANAEVTRMCMLPIPGDNFLDLSMQINRRKMILEGREINRLCKFSTETVSQVVIQLDGNSGQAGRLTPVNEIHYGVSLLLDFNTVPDGERIPNKHHSSIFNSLLDEAHLAAEEPSIDFLISKD